MSILQHILIATWQVTQQMAPFMLFGFLMAGLVSVFLSPATVQRHLGKRNVLQTIKAALFGVPPEAGRRCRGALRVCRVRTPFVDIGRRFNYF